MVNVMTGASPHGQGQETTFAQLGAEVLGLEPGDINVIHGDTAIVPYGIGTFGSRGTAVGGTAVYKSLMKLREKLAVLAGFLMDVDAKKLVFDGMKIFSKSQSKKSLPFGEVVAAAYTARRLPPNMEPGLDATTFFEPANFTFPFGSHVCVVEIDAETGDVKLLKYVAVDDCSNVLNPLLVDGQVHGGIVQSFGQAMLEEAVYDEQGQLSTGELMDYAIPRATDMPWMETDRTVTPPPVNPMGVKGIGEAGTIGATRRSALSPWKRRCAAKNRRTSSSLRRPTTPRKASSRFPISMPRPPIAVKWPRFIRAELSCGRLHARKKKHETCRTIYSPVAAG
jgi:carbon-monoxide dehydrogenase large subunit